MVLLNFMLNMLASNFHRFMYAVGGQDGVSCLNIVEKYDSVANHWSRVAPMSTRRLGVAVAVLDGYLFAIGGSDGTSPLNTVEKYDPKNNQWIPIKPMGTKRKHLGAAVYQGCIYVGEFILLLKYVDNKFIIYNVSYKVKHIMKQMVSLSARGYCTFCKSRFNLTSYISYLTTRSSTIHSLRSFL